MGFLRKVCLQGPRFLQTSHTFLCGNTSAMECLWVVWASSTINRTCRVNVKDNCRRPSYYHIFQYAHFNSAAHLCTNQRNHLNHTQLLCGNYAGSAYAIWHSFLCWAYSNRNLKNSLTVDPPLVRKSIISLLWGLLWQGTWHFPHCRVSSSKDINDFLTAEFPSVRILDSSTQLLCTKPRNHLKPYPIIMRELCGIYLCYLAFLSVLGLLK